MIPNPPRLSFKNIKNVAISAFFISASVFSSLSILSSKSRGAEILASSLDQPVLLPVTVRSEAERGLSAFVGPVPPPGIMREYVEALAEKNRRLNTWSVAFSFGVYYEAWHCSWQAASSSAVPPYDRAVAQANAWYFHMVTSEIRKQLNLSSTQVQVLAGERYVPSEEAAFAAASKSGKYLGTMRSIGDIRRSDRDLQGIRSANTAERID